jgi:hypothetical protein
MHGNLAGTTVAWVVDDHRRQQTQTGYAGHARKMCCSRLMMRQKGFRVVAGHRIVASDRCKRKRTVELMTIGKNGQGDGAPEQLRPARMQIETTVLMSRHGESHPTELVDISATGALLRRPLGWSGETGQSWVLDMIFGHDLHIHLEAVVARISDHHIGFSYSRIPEDKQVPLWNLLGGYADILEYWKNG